MGRPKLNIDPKLVYDLAAIGCKNTEIATIVGCSADTIDGRFSEEVQKGREDLKKSLRRWQLDAAKKGNVAMLIWLGKQMLGQTEKIEQNTTAKIETLSPAEVKDIIAKDPFLNASGHGRSDQSTKIAN